MHCVGLCVYKMTVLLGVQKGPESGSHRPSHHSISKFTTTLYEIGQSQIVQCAQGLRGPVPSEPLRFADRGSQSLLAHGEHARAPLRHATCGLSPIDQVVPVPVVMVVLHR